MTEEQILKQREQLKRAEHHRMKKYYENLEKRSIETIKKAKKLDYNKKFERARKRKEATFDKKTQLLIKNEKRSAKWETKLKYKPRKTSITWTKIKALLQKYVRLRDTWEDWYWNCIVTGKRIHRKEWNWWHYISASYKATALDLDNIHLQSAWSNKAMSMWDKTAEYHKQLYRENLLRKIWDKRLLALETRHAETKYQIFKISKPELEAIWNEYTPLVRKMESEKHERNKRGNSNGTSKE